MTEAVIADKGYDSDALVAAIEAIGAQAIIAPRSNRRTKRKVDWHRDKARNLVERVFNRLKQFRRLATRYDKLACRYNAFLHAPIFDYCEHALASRTAPVFKQEPGQSRLAASYSTHTHTHT